MAYTGAMIIIDQSTGFMKVFDVVKKRTVNVYYFTLFKLKNEERILAVSMLLSPT